MDEMRVYLESMSRDRDGFVGAWFTCPVNWEEVVEKLMIENEEQFEIADSELPFPVRADMPLWELNMQCDIVRSMDGTPVGNELKAIIKRWFSGFTDFMDHKEEIRFYCYGEPALMAEFLIWEEQIFGELPDELHKYIDYNSLGRELEESGEYLFTSSGVFCYK